MGSKKTLTLLCLAPIEEGALRDWLFQPTNMRIIFPEKFQQSNVRSVATNADLILGDWRGRLGIYEAEATAASRCIFIQQPSVGVELVDLEITRILGIPVANAAGFNTRAVTEWILGAALCSIRSIAWVDSEVRKGNWPYQELIDRRGYELLGKRVGIVGFGAIGSSVAQIFAAIGCDVYYWSRRQRSQKEERGAKFIDLDLLLGSCDVVCVTVAKTTETIGLLNRRRINLLQDNSVLVDCSRGGIVDQGALEERLRNKEIMGCALDVFETEPLRNDSGLRDLQSVVLSSHAAGKTAESQLSLRRQVADNLILAMNGELPRNIVNGVNVFRKISQ